MTGYVKLFSSIIGSTIWREDPPTKVVWVTMLALADRYGEVMASVPGLANYAGVTVEQAEAALQKFLSPDRYSRTPDHEGRRIENIDGGWRLLNYEVYRRKMSEEDRREQDRIRQQRKRARDASVTERDGCDTSRTSQQGQMAKEEGRGPKEKENEGPQEGPGDGPPFSSFDDGPEEQDTDPLGLSGNDDDFDYCEWGLKTAKAYPYCTLTRGLPEKLLESYREQIDYLVEAMPSLHGSKVEAAKYLLEKVRAYASHKRNTPKKFIATFDNFLKRNIYCQC